MIGARAHSAIGRRELMKSAIVTTAGVALVANLTPSSAAAQRRKATFVLVHGAWHGGWCWKRTAPLLQAKGHEVHSPTLTVLGDRVHLASLRTNLSTHISDIVNHLFMEDAKNIILVGHNYAGMVVTGVADRVPGRIRSLVYLDAFVPEDGKSAVDYQPPDRRRTIEESAKETGFVDPVPLPAFGVTNPDDLNWANPRIRPQPFATLTQPLKLRTKTSNIPRTYIRCTDPAFSTFEQFAQKYRNDPAWKYYEIAVGHDAMIVDPKGLAEILTKLV